MITSDIDVTIFLNTGNYDNNETRSINRKLSLIERILEKYQHTIRFTHLNHIRNAKVPVLTMSFQNESYIKGMDFVINNKYGVWNSRLF